MITTHVSMWASLPVVGLVADASADEPGSTATWVAFMRVIHRLPYKHTHTHVHPHCNAHRVAASSNEDVRGWSVPLLGRDGSACCVIPHVPRCDRLESRVVRLHAPVPDSTRRDAAQ